VLLLLYIDMASARKTVKEDSTFFDRESFEKFFLSIMAIKTRDFVSVALDVCHKRCTFSIEVWTSKPEIPSQSFAIFEPRRDTALHILI
jgi:hypothetical protein